MDVSLLRTLIAASLAVPLTLGLPGCSGGNERPRNDFAVESGARGGVGGASGISGNAGSMLTGNGGSTQGGASGSGTGGSAAFAGAAGAGARGGSAGSGGGSGSGAQSGSAGQGDGGSAGAGACRKGSALPVGRCRTGADCGGGSICAPTLLTGGCGFLMPARRDCETDTSCGDGRICVAAPTGSAPPCTMGTPTSCIDACSEDSCGDDQVCGTDGRCRLATCEEGYTCSEGRVCRAGMAGTDARGCDAASCETDGYACPDTHHCAPQVATADAHGCTPKNCSEDGWACPEGFVCSNPSNDVHGCACDSDDDCTGVDRVCNSGACVVKTCESDADCSCGVCVNGVPGQCLPDFYFCAMLVP